MIFKKEQWSTTQTTTRNFESYQIYKAIWTLVVRWDLILSNAINFMKQFIWFFRDFELGPIVNRDLSRRVRTVNGITVDRKVVRNNIKLAAKVITNLDKKWELWQKPQETPQDADKAQASIDMGIISNNPILNNITDYLIEEASAEEEELLGNFYFLNRIIVIFSLATI